MASIELFKDRVLAPSTTTLAHELEWHALPDDARALVAKLYTAGRLAVLLDVAEDAEGSPIAAYEKGWSDACDEYESFRPYPPSVERIKRELAPREARGG